MVKLHARLRLSVLALACALGGACAPVGQLEERDGLGLRSSFWRADDRVLITDFSMIGAVAADQRFAFAAGRNGALVYDHRFDRWLPPLTLEDGFPAAEMPVALEVDGFAGTLWMTTRTGALYAHDIMRQDEWRWLGVLPGAPPVSLIAHEGSLWALTDAGWFETAGSSAPVRARPPAAVMDQTASHLERLERSSGGFRSAAATLTIDEWLRRWDITSAAPSSVPARWFLGTWGGGLYAYDDRMLDAQPMRYGSVGRGVSAIGAVPGDGGFWFGGDGLDRRRGLARASRDLQRWTWYEAGRQGAPNGGTHAIVESELGVFVAAADGLYRQSGEYWDRLTDGDALPSTTVRSLLVAAGAVWAGTDRGLARVGVLGDALTATRIDGTSGARINALAQRDSTLWIGTDRGLLSLNLHTGVLAQPPSGDPRLRERIVGLAHDAPTLYVLTESALLAWDGATWMAPPPPASLATIGRPMHLAARDGVVWISGAAGALGLEPMTGAETVLSIPRDIPEGPVRQSLPVAGGIWFATPAGALLIRFE